MQTILVTGATGFIGRNLLSELIDSREYKLRAVTRTEARLDGRVEQLRGDLMNDGFLEKAFRKVDAVVHLAALRPGKKGYPEDCWKVNYALTRKLLDRSVENGIEHFIFCSSVGVTGWAKELPMNEATPYNPVGTYHETKAAAERLVLRYNDLVPTTIVRPTITYGSWDTDGLVAKIFQLVARGFFVFVGNGGNHLHLAYVNNIVKGFDLVLQHGGHGKTYILADETAIRMCDLVDYIASLLRIPYRKIVLPYHLAKGVMVVCQAIGKKIRFESLPEATVESADIMSRNRCYSIRAAQELGYRPQCSTIEGLRISAAWYRRVIHR
jgi:nucleoside-diphosphate-sugar epimerase